MKDITQSFLANISALSISSFDNQGFHNAVHIEMTTPLLAILQHNGKDSHHTERQSVSLTMLLSRSMGISYQLI